MAFKLANSNKTFNFNAMLKNIFTLSFRNFKNRPFIAILNIIGLTLGIAFFILTAIYVEYMFSIDTHHKNSERIYISAVSIDFEDYHIVNQTATPASFAKTLKNEFPEVVASTRIREMGRAIIYKNDNIYKEENVCVVDSTFFDVFTYNSLHGNLKNVLNEPSKIVITKSMAEKYFKKTDVIGEILNLFEVDSEYQIVAVIDDPPENSNFNFDIFLPMVVYPNDFINNEIWQNNNFTTYFILREDANVLQLKPKVHSILKQKFGTIDGTSYEDWVAAGNRWEYSFYTIKDHYLNIRGNNIYINSFSIIAIFILIIACINYINMKTAKASLRSKEIGVRKVIGANRTKLITQFFGESIITSFLATILSMGIVETLLPYLSIFIDAELKIHYLDNIYIIPLLLILGLLIGILSGFYPALILSGFDPILVLKGKYTLIKNRFSLRNILVFVQFVVATVLIIGSLVIFKQTNMMVNKNLGFDKENLLILRGAGYVDQYHDDFIQSLKRIPGIKEVSFSSRTPSRSSGPVNQFDPKGKTSTLLSVIMVDENYMDAMKIKLKKGRFFDKTIQSDSAAIIVNEAAMKLINWGDTLNKTISCFAGNFKVIGILEDYHSRTLHFDIQPLAMLYLGGEYPYTSSFINVRLEPGDQSQIIKKIEEIWKEFSPNAPFEYYFYNQRYETYYDRETKTSTLILVLTLVIVIITILGLFSLAIFTTEEKLKEIGIRKVLGAQKENIVYNLTWQFSKIVLLANILAWPITWYITESWLKNFSTRIKITPIEFILAMIICYVIAITTIIGQTLIAANKNPIDIIKYE
jgi:putative ABC transport system permease protein